MTTRCVCGRTEIVHEDTVTFTNIRCPYCSPAGATDTAVTKVSLFLVKPQRGMENR